MCVVARVWAWVKKYWKYLLFPVGIILGILALINRDRIGKVVAPEAVKAEEARARHEAEARVRAAEAEAAKKAAVEKLEKEHAGTIEKLTDQQKERVEELRENPDKLSEFLIGVGREVRG